MDAQVSTAGPPPAARAPLGFSLASDERLALLAGRGSERAFTTLYRRHHQQLYRYCLAIVRDETDAQDVLQSTFASAYSALRRGRRDAPLRPWLFRIAHNEAISALRRRRPQEELSEEIAPAAASAEDVAVARERLGALVADLAELPERHRSALLMRELSGLSHREIALALETSASGARQAIFEARRTLLEFEQGRAMACEDVQRLISDGDRRALRARRVRAHMRHCGACTAFAAAIPRRASELNALLPPLAPAVAGGLLAEALGRGAGHGAAKATTVGIAGKAAGVAAVSKAVVAAAVVAGTAVGVGTLAGSSPAPSHHRTGQGQAVGLHGRGATGGQGARTGSGTGTSDHSTRAGHGGAGGKAHRSGQPVPAAGGTRAGGETTHGGRANGRGPSLANDERGHRSRSPSAPRRSRVGAGRHVAHRAPTAPRHELRPPPPAKAERVRPEHEPSEPATTKARPESAGPVEEIAPESP